MAEYGSTNNALYNSHRNQLEHHRKLSLALLVSVTLLALLAFVAVVSGSSSPNYDGKDLLSQLQPLRHDGGVDVHTMLLNAQQLIAQRQSTELLQDDDDEGFVLPVPNAFSLPDPESDLSSPDSSLAATTNSGAHRQNVKHLVSKSRAHLAASHLSPPSVKQIVPASDASPGLSSVKAYSDLPRGEVDRLALDPKLLDEKISKERYPSGSPTDSVKPIRAPDNARAAEQADRKGESFDAEMREFEHEADADATKDKLSAATTKDRDSSRNGRSTRQWMRDLSSFLPPGSEAVPSGPPSGQELPGAYGQNQIPMPPIHLSNMVPS